MTETASETTPLLTSENEPQAQDEAVSNESNPEEPALVNTSSEYLPASAYFPKPVKYLTALILIVSAIAPILLIAAFLVHTTVLSGYLWTPMGESIMTLGTLFLICLIVARMNQRYPISFPILINLLFDYILSYSLFVALSDLSTFGFPTARWCKDSRSAPDCERGRIAITILMGIVGVLALIAGLAHVVLFCLRCIALWKSRFWTRLFPAMQYSIPTGQLTLEFTIKLLRQETGVERTARIRADEN